jgi:hypothetical protein
VPATKYSLITDPDNWYNVHQEYNTGGLLRASMCILGKRNDMTNAMHSAGENMPQENGYGMDQDSSGKKSDMILGRCWRI